MKKRNLKNLVLNKQSISKFSTTIIGGREVSINETNCDYCPVDPGPSGGGNETVNTRITDCICSIICYPI